MREEPEKSIKCVKCVKKDIKVGAIVLTEICKNATETIRVDRAEYQGKDLLDVRVWVTDPAGEEKPTKKGLCLRPATWRELLPAIQEALLEETDDDQAGGADTTALRPCSGR